MSVSDLVVTRRGLRFANRYFPCVVGRSGVTATKSEGDGATPIGHHNIVGCLYRPDRIARPSSWALPIRPGDFWSDDPADVNYNQPVRAPYELSHETLRRADPLYDLILLTDWNWPVSVPGRGSAIFIHRWRRPGFPTEGCVALQPTHLRWICENISPGTIITVR